MDLRGPRSWVRRHPQVADAVLAAVLVGGGVVATVQGQGGPSQALHLSDLAPFVTAWVVITGRRLWPGSLLVIDSAMTAGCIIATRERTPIVVVAGLVVAFTFASRVERRRALPMAMTCAAVTFVAGGIFAAGGWWSPQNVATFAWTFAAVALGDATRSRNAYVAEVEARALRAEQTHEDEARRRVTEERLRIARELHDVIAHHIAVISVQAGAASHVLHSRPEAVGPALANIRRAADVAVKELAGMVGLLRNADDLESSVQPVRGLAGLAELLETFAAAGLRVRYRQHGDARELPTLTDLAAFRIIQESLTNAQKHGNGQATLDITFEPDRVRIVVSNPVRAQREQGRSGFGIVGMRERAAATGGAVTTNLDHSGQFVVDAFLPAPSQVLPAPVDVA